MQVRVADVVIFDILLGRAEVVFAPILGGLDLLHIALPNQTADLIRRVRGGDLHHAGKLRDGRLAHRHDPLHAEGLYRGQRGLAGGEALKHVLVEVQLKFSIDVIECFFQHGAAPFDSLNFF